MKWGGRFCDKRYKYYIKYYWIVLQETNQLIARNEHFIYTGSHKVAVWVGRDCREYLCGILFAIILCYTDGLNDESYHTIEKNIIDVFNWEHFLISRSRLTGDRVSLPVQIDSFLNFF